MFVRWGRAVPYRSCQACQAAKLAASGLQEGHWAANCPVQDSAGQYGGQGGGGRYQEGGGGYKAPGTYGNPGMTSPPKAGGAANGSACFKCGQVCPGPTLYTCLEGGCDKW